jgi:HIV Tat-specific factor 1
MDESGACKGDCSLCFNAEASVKMAIDILSGGFIRPSHQISVSKADFKKAEPANTSEAKRPKLTPAQYKVAQSVMKNALAWNEDDDIGLTSAKGLKIVVIENLFKPSDFSENKDFERELEEDIASECSKCGEIKKITIFSKNKKGVVVVKFATAFSAQECINLTNGRHFGGNILKSYFWDGVTNFSEATPFERDLEEKKEEERIHEFGDWLEKEQDDLPEEFQLRVEDD